MRRPCADIHTARRTCGETLVIVGKAALTEANVRKRKHRSCLGNCDRRRSRGARSSGRSAPSRSAPLDRLAAARPAGRARAGRRQRPERAPVRRGARLGLRGRAARRRRLALAGHRPASSGTPPAAAARPAAASRPRSVGWCWSPAAPRSPAAWPHRRTPLRPHAGDRARQSSQPSQGLPLPDRATTATHVGHLVARRRPPRSTGPARRARRPGPSWSGPATRSGASPTPRSPPTPRPSRGRRALAADLPRQPRRDRRRPRPDPARPATAPPPALRGVPMSPFHEKVVPLRTPVPVGSIQGTLALDLHPRHDPPEPADRRRPRRGRRGADRPPRPAAGSSSGPIATRRPPWRSSAATGRSPSCCAGRRRASTTTSPAGPSWSPAPSDNGRARTGCSRCGPRCCGVHTCFVAGDAAEVSAHVRYGQPLPRARHPLRAPRRTVALRGPRVRLRLE